MVLLCWRWSRPRRSWLVPRAVMAGIILVGALGLADPDILRLVGTAARARPYHRVEIAGNLLIMAAVAGAAIWFGLVGAVAAGAVPSLGVFATLMAQGPARRSYRNPLGRSPHPLPGRRTPSCCCHGGAIEGVELQGAIFFGSADHVAAYIERVLKRGSAYVILDLRRVNRIDLPARARPAANLRTPVAGRPLGDARRRPPRPARVGLSRRPRPGPAPAARARVRPARGRRRRRRGGTAGAPSSAMHVEDRLHPGGRACRRSACNPPAIALLPAYRVLSYARRRARHPQRRQFELGVPAAGGPARRTLPVAGEDGGRMRVATFTAGTLVGEMALISGAPRSADVVARTPARCLRLDLDVLAQLRTDDPEAAWHLLRAIAGQIERNLRMVNAAIISYEE